MDFGEKREVGREILSLSNLLYRKIEYDKKKSGIYDLQYVQGGIIKYIKENPQKDIFPRDIVKALHALLLPVFCRRWSRMTILRCSLIPGMRD